MTTSNPALEQREIHWHDLCLGRAVHVAIYYPAGLSSSPSHKECRNHRNGTCLSSSEDAKESVRKMVRDDLLETFFPKEAAHTQGMSQAAIASGMNGAQESVSVLLQALNKLHCCMSGSVPDVQRECHQLLDQRPTNPKRIMHPVTRSHITSCALCQELHVRYKLYFPELASAPALSIDEQK